jgi:zinc/manganese transport system substrate-binding protein
MSSRPMTLTAGLAALAALAMVVAGCGSSSGQTPAANNANPKIAVVASTNVWGSVVQAVGGDAVSVKSIISDPSADPHSYPDKPETATTVSEAKLLVYNGGGYDDFFTKLADTSGKNAKKIVAFDVAAKGPSGSTNEHVWYDLPSVKKVADKIAEELGAMAPDKKDTFTSNAKTFDGKLDELIAKAQKIGKDKPGAKVVVTEPVPEYLIETAGLTNATPEEFSKAVEQGSEPSASAVAEITDLVTGKKVAAVLNNAQTETPVTKALKESANKSGVPVVDVTETLPEGVTSYVDWMTKQVDALASAIAKT